MKTSFLIHLFFIKNSFNFVFTRIQQKLATFGLLSQCSFRLVHECMVKKKTLNIHDWNDEIKHSLIRTHRLNKYYSMRENHLFSFLFDVSPRIEIIKFVNIQMESINKENFLSSNIALFVF